MKFRPQLVLSLSLLGVLAPSSTAFAQVRIAAAPSADAACACHADPDTTGVAGGDNDGRTLLIFGAAGLAVLSGMPFGGTSLQGLPFAAAEAPPMPEVAEVVEMVEAPGALTPETPAAPIATAPVAARAMVPMPLEPTERAGMVPPQTATHLPLLAAIGLLMVGSGGLLARRDSRERRRKRRFVAL